MPKYHIILDIQGEFGKDPDEMSFNEKADILDALLMAGEESTNYSAHAEILKIEEENEGGQV